MQRGRRVVMLDLLGFGPPTGRFEPAPEGSRSRESSGPRRGGILRVRGPGAAGVPARVCKGGVVVALPPLQPAETPTRSAPSEAVVPPRWSGYFALCQHLGSPIDPSPRRGWGEKRLS